MINQNAYKEVHEIIKILPNDEQQKIPQSLLKMIKEKANNANYEFDIENFYNDNLLEDTEKILSVLYTDYLSTEEEHQIILAKEKILAYKQDLKKAKKYPSNFKL